MSNRITPNPDVPQSRRQQLRREQERAAGERRVRTRVTLAVLGIVAAAVLGVLTWVIVNGAGSTTAPPPSGEDQLVIGDPAAPVELAIYQDFLCPACGAFEQVNRADIEQLVADGTARVLIHPMNFKDHSSLGTRFSTRAANALVAVARTEPDKVLAFNAAIFDDQPEQNTPGLSDAEIAELARQVGVSESVIGTFAQLAHEQFVQASNDAALTRIRSTPTVFINGEQFDNAQLFTPGPLKAAVEQAAGRRG